MTETKKPCRRSPTAGNRNQGSKWITPKRRCAIYHRDGWACVYCGCTSNGAGRKLTLDHLTTRSKGGSNATTNLVTACMKCNVERGALTLGAWLGRGRAREIRKLARRLIDTVTDRSKLRR